MLLRNNNILNILDILEKIKICHKESQKKLDKMIKDMVKRILNYTVYKILANILRIMLKDLFARMIENMSEKY